MRSSRFSLDPALNSRRIRFVSVVLCYALLSPCIAAIPDRTATKLAHDVDQRNGWLSHPLPTPTPADGKREVTIGPYIPPALRTDHAERRANGKDGKHVEAPPAKRGAPVQNLPDLADSRKIRKSPITKRASSSVSDSTDAETDSGQPIQVEMICADCDPGGGGGAGGSDPYFGTARTRPVNATGAAGVTLGSRNFNWSMPLVSLPGRAGLDLTVSLFYNSLVWTAQGNAVQYNPDHGTPAPGFQLGLPRLQGPFFDSDDNSYAYIMVAPSGGRVEMKQVGSTNTYE